MLAATIVNVVWIFISFSSLHAHRVGAQKRVYAGFGDLHRNE